MNSITIAGNVSRDMEIRQAGKDEVGSFSIADNQGKDKPAIFWQCNIWGARARSLEKYITKGQSVTVSGTVTEREYVKDGVTKKAMDIRVNDVALQGGRREESAPARQAVKSAGKHSTPEQFDDSDIPF